MRRFSWFLAVVVLPALAASARADLAEYIKKPEPKYSWKLKQNSTGLQGKTYEIELVSQEWHGITWTHTIEVYQPKGVLPGATMLLYNTGGQPNFAVQIMGFELARRIKAPVAILYDVPNQPLFDGKKEDALIAETFVRTLETKDTSWPLLFPMAKSVVKAMDALQDFSKDTWKEPVKQFVVSGASKRGWTTWLAAAADARIVAFVPIVIDTLNMTKQMDNQLTSFGEYSAMIHDYTERKLVPLPKTDEAKELWQMVDPYFYRDRLKQPKLIINGTNDPYWTVDALNLYWDGLRGDKWVLYVPNASHDLKEPDGGRTRVLNALAAFTRHQMLGKTMPGLKWQHDDAEGKARLRVEMTVAPDAARVWQAEAPTRDFRKAKWTSEAATPADKAITVSTTLPREGFKAFFVEMDYEIDGIKYNLSTQLRVLKMRKE